MNDNPAEPGGRDRDTKLRLLEAALSIVTSAGVAGATSRQIASAAGTNLQAITYHFGSKDELVAQALVSAVRAWTEPARQSLEGLADDPAGQLQLAIERLQSVLDSAMPRVPAYLEALAQVPRNEQFRHQIQTLLAELRADVAQALTELKAAGYLAGWLDPQAMASLVIAAADGTAIHLALDPDGTDVRAIANQVVPLLLAASTVEPPARPASP